MQLLKDKKNILWDFDGVLMDSMPVRNRGFEIVLKNFPKTQVEALMKFHLENGGLSRYVKFRYFFEEIRGEEITEKQVNEWAGRFSEVMKKELVSPQLLINDTIQFIKNNTNRFKMHIVSGSDGSELRYLCKEMDLTKFFVSIHGSPTPKNDLVRDLLEREKYNLSETVLVGDSFNDYDAAKINNIDFIGYNNSKMKDNVELTYIRSFLHE